MSKADLFQSSGREKEVWGRDFMKNQLSIDTGHKHPHAFLKPAGLWRTTLLSMMGLLWSTAQSVKAWSSSLPSPLAHRGAAHRWAAVWQERSGGSMLVRRKS